MIARGMTCIVVAILALHLGAAAAAAQPAGPEQILDQRGRWTCAQDEQTDALRAQLAREIEAIVDAGDHIAPINMHRGIGGRAQMWGAPADTVSTLCAAAPLLDEPLRGRALDHAAMLVAKYPPWRVGWEARGVDRSLWIVPEPFTPTNGEAPTGPTPGGLYALWQYADAAGDWALIQQNWPAIAAVGAGLADRPRVQSVQSGSFRVNSYDRQLAVNIPGAAHLGPGSIRIEVTLDNDPRVVETFTDNRRGQLTGDLGGEGTIDYEAGIADLTLGQDPAAPGAMTEGRARRRLHAQVQAQMLGARSYARLAGLIGYARLAEAIDAPQAPQAREAALAMIRDVIARGYGAMYKYAWDDFGHTRSHDWMYPPFHQRRDSRGRTSTIYCPEVLRLLAEHDAEAVGAHLEGYIEGANFRSWFLNYGSMPPDGVNTSAQQGVPGGEALGGENSVLPPGLGWTFYLLKAHVTGAEPEQLRQWIDLPYARAGDLHHIERIIAALRAGGAVEWVPAGR